MKKRKSFKKLKKMDVIQTHLFFFVVILVSLLLLLESQPVECEPRPPLKPRFWVGLARRHTRSAPLSSSSSLACSPFSLSPRSCVLFLKFFFFLFSLSLFLLKSVRLSQERKKKREREEREKRERREREERERCCARAVNWERKRKRGRGSGDDSDGKRLVVACCSL